VFRDCGWTKTLEISTDAVLFFDRKFVIGKTLEEIDDVDGCDETGFEVVTIDAGDDAV